ncbi:hypothetical protein CGW93_02185 [candidate division bacterium WOR-3 4484_18]|uniref:Uncharacterized protein n=1 Tax=candidate division WOR-3 bacterium 4484_18 TaxID=2020626 RepID=A0A257LUS5_UNCW3|nr:MAG: hypothetical protein CGW93_02185 [candidate division bacterium WOR-3 4484_18]
MLQLLLSATIMGGAFSDDTLLYFYTRDSLYWQDTVICVDGRLVEGKSHIAIYSIDDGWLDCVLWDKYGHKLYKLKVEVDTLEFGRLELSPTGDLIILYDRVGRFDVYGERKFPRSTSPWVPISKFNLYTSIEFRDKYIDEPIVYLEFTDDGEPILIELEDYRSPRTCVIWYDVDYSEPACYELEGIPEKWTLGDTCLWLQTYEIEGNSIARTSWLISKTTKRMLDVPRAIMGRFTPDGTKLVLVGKEEITIVGLPEGEPLYVYHTYSVPKVRDIKVFDDGFALLRATVDRDEHGFYFKEPQVLMMDFSGKSQIEFMFWGVSFYKPVWQVLPDQRKLLLLTKGGVKQQTW